MRMKSLKPENKKYKTVSVTIDGVKQKVHIKKHPGLDEWIMMVETIVNLVFDLEIRTIEGYSPSVLEFARRSALIQGFTDFKVSDGYDYTPTSFWNVIMESGLYKEILHYAREDASKILEVADDAIAARVGYLQNQTDINAFINKMTSKLDDFGKNFTKTDATDIMSIVKKMNGMGTEDIVSSIMKTVSDDKSKIN